MNMVTLASTHNTSLSQTFPSNVDASFSPYLSGKEAFAVRGFAEPSRNLIPMIATAQDKHFPLGRKKEEDDEIGVFGAEKYFNGVIDDDASSRISSRSSTISYPYKNDGRLNMEQLKGKIQPRTPSVRSESSWNSRSVLLQSGLKNSSRTKSGRLNGRKFLASFGGKCSCSDKNSVEVKDVGEISFHKSPSNASHKSAVHHKASIISPARPGLNHVEPQIHKPPKLDILSAKPPSGLRHFPVRSPLQGQHGDQILCKSPEVFGSPALQRGSKTLSLDRRMTMMSWDRPGAVTATPSCTDEIVFNANSSGNHHDSGSDASSDLFEIDSLTGKTNPFLARRPSDDQTSGCVTPTTGYAPSEASIQWSVVTASAADYSVMSDCEETITRPASKTRMSKEFPRRSILLGCKSQKAVNVAGDAYRATTPRASYEPNMRFRSDSPARFQAEIAKLTDFNSRVGQHSLAQLPRLASPGNSHLLYSQ
ncbi:hypothetical protein TIFTF001_011057 [Ficus carica]|uniref:Protein PHYTOCHROME KINASE SUBSTRATE 1-like n=1 Tax=Ficus carica TaxID=3494 RepID=A0AA87ZXK4_FICCA|nr:hypothetical protein TIFTF001_011057 [Ficus carica]